MREKWDLNLRLFDGGAAAGAAGGGAGGTSAEGASGESGVEILADGTRMDPRLAERIEKQRKRHPERYAAGTAAPTGDRQGTAPQGTNRQETPAQGNQAQTAKTPEQEFDELIKGKYAAQYQARFQQAISDRFRNQEDLQGKLDSLKPMLDALAKQRGVKEGDWDALSKNILDDDSLYEEEAEAQGMTVAAYKNFKKLEAEANAAREAAARNQQQMEIRAHFQNLARQADALKQVFPNFDLQEELKNPQFRRMTSPNSGLSVEQAYYAIHHAELAPQAMAAGIQVARQQFSQSMQANAARPVEGAMQGAAQAAEIHVSPRNMTRAQRAELRERARRGETIVL